MMETRLGVETYKKGPEEIYFTRILEEGKTIFECAGTGLTIDGIILLLNKIKKGSKLSIGEYDKYVREAFEM